MGARSIGVIGLGTMGLGVAQSLVRGGLTTHVCDVRPEPVQAIVAAGGQGHADPAALAPHVDALIIMVVNAAQTDAVLFGEKGAARGLKPGSVVIVSTTVSPDYADRLSKRLTAMGFTMLDAPVSGGGIRAAEGKLSVMASGPAAAFENCEDLFAAIAAKVYRVGEEVGAGSVVKMINQLLAGVHIAAAAEAMALGIKAGADPAVLHDVISHSAGTSWMFENRVPRILTGDYVPPHSAVDIFVKDLGIVTEFARDKIFPLPLASTAHQMFMQASAAGHGREDDAAVIKVFPGIALPGC